MLESESNPVDIRRQRLSARTRALKRTTAILRKRLRL